MHAIMVNKGEATGIFVLPKNCHIGQKNFKTLIKTVLATHKL